MKDIETCKTNYLLGGQFWYPFQSLEVNKQIDFAVRFAEHFNDDVIKHCSHIDKGFKTCPRRWDNIKIRKYLSNYTILKSNKGNACEIFERTTLMHDLMKFNEPVILKLFLEKGVTLHGTSGFPPFLQLLCHYTKPFVKKYNSLIGDKTIPFNYEVDKIRETLLLLEENNCDFGSPCWVFSKKDKLYSPHPVRRIFDELCGSLTHADLFEIVLRGLLRDGTLNHHAVINRAVRIAARHANHDVVKYIVNNFNDSIDRTVKCPLHIAVSGGSLKCVELLIDSLNSLTREYTIDFPNHKVESDWSVNYNTEIDPTYLKLTGTPFECAKSITQTQYCIDFEEWSDFTSIIDLLKKREQDKRKKNDKRKKQAGKKNLENKENDPILSNGHGDLNGLNGKLPTSSKASEMEKDLEALQRTYHMMKNGENKSASNMKPVQKSRLIQACPIQVKEKSVQTITDDNVLKQLELKDKKITELERSLLKARKQIDKNSKLEKEISDLRAVNLRQSKELENVKNMKKKHKEQIEEISLKSEEFENILKVEQSTTKQLKSKNAELLNINKELKSKIQIQNKSPNISTEDFQNLVSENRNIKEQIALLKSEAKKGKREKDDVILKSRQQNDKLNQVKKVLEESYKEALNLETIVKMYPDKLKLYHMSEEISNLRGKIRNMTEEYERKNDFHENGIESENSAIVEENLKLSKENQSLRKEKEQLNKWRRTIIRKYKIEEEIE